jgi:hypothetical protein
MMLIQKPKDINAYYDVADADINIFLQYRNHHPKYFYNKCYYYKKTNRLKKDLELYHTKYEGEVNGFVKGL